MFTDDRHAFRQAYFIAWQKYQKKLPLDVLETQLVDIMLMHAEYHALLNKPDALQQQEFALEENPFFHMSLHMAVQEQIRTDRPIGINALYQQLLTKYDDAHTVQHHMMQALAQTLWQAQQNGSMVSEDIYINKLKAL